MRLNHGLRLLILPLLLSACGGPVNTYFSCNKTAGDSCLSIEEVDAMTQFANAGKVVSGKKPVRKPYRQLAQLENEKNLWIVKGGRHAG